jgi:hypothetical protein
MPRNYSPDFTVVAAIASRYVLILAHLPSLISSLRDQCHLHFLPLHFLSQRQRAGNKQLTQLTSRGL